jgi:hypothetical protein
VAKQQRLCGIEYLGSLRVAVEVRAGGRHRS